MQRDRATERDRRTAEKTEGDGEKVEGGEEDEEDEEEDAGGYPCWYVGVEKERVKKEVYCM